MRTQTAAAAVEAAVVEAVAMADAAEEAEAAIAAPARRKYAATSASAPGMSFKSRQLTLSPSHTRCFFIGSCIFSMAQRGDG